MASLYRPTYTKTDPKTGARVTRQVRKWYGRFRGSSGKRRSVPLCEDKTAAMAILRDMIREEKPQRSRVLDPVGRHISQPIEYHLRGYRLHLEVLGRSPSHIGETSRLIKNVCDACCIRSLEDLQTAEEKLEKHLMERRRTGLSHRTINADLIAVRAFCRWLIQRRRIYDDPTVGLRRLNEDEDPRVRRRALADVETARLYFTTSGSKRIVRGLSGEQRATLYLLALRTGLRRGELRSLTPSSFDLSTTPASVIISASKSKRRRVDRLPLPPGVASNLRQFLAGQSAGDYVWPGTWWQVSAKMLRQDLSDCGVAAEDDEGRIVDFHALRTTFITSLARAGVAPALAQKLARHSDVNLTLGVYTQLQLTDLAHAVDRLPSIIPAGTLDDG